MKTLRIVISGRVQGVGFRYFLRQKAQLLGITGYAENKPDNTLEVVAQSENEEQLKEFIKECRRGPILAVVDKVSVSEVNSDRNYSFFDIR